MDRKIRRRPFPSYPGQNPFQGAEQNPFHPSQSPYQSSYKGAGQGTEQNPNTDRWSWGTGLGSGLGHGLGHGLRPGFGSMEWFERERGRAERRMEVLKKEIEDDPYGVLFGRRLAGQKPGLGMGQLWRDLFGDGADAGKSATSGSKATDQGVDRAERVKTEQVKTEQVKTEQNVGEHGPLNEALDREVLEFDPIAGRMVAKNANRGDFDPITGKMTPKGYLSPIERDLDFQQPEQEAKAPEPEAKNEPEEKPQEMNMAARNISQAQSDAQSTLKQMSTESETPTPSKAKLKIQDSTQQAEPILVPEDQELDLLRASDIRASYPKLSSEPQRAKPVDQGLRASEPQKDLGQELNSIEDRVSGLAEDAAVLKSQVRDVSEAQDAVFKSEQDVTTTAKQTVPGKTYCVLAYDPSTQQVTRADTTSSLSLSSETSHPKDILPRLNHPAKFLDHFAQMHKEGYEIVSGGGDILVFRFRDQVPLPREAEKAEVTESALADPQVLEHMAASMPKQAVADDVPAEKKTPKRGFRDALRRMAFAGTATAATCYAIGVVTEYFRTGGQDGRGIDGFTAFESERRAMR